MTPSLCGGNQALLVALVSELHGALRAAGCRAIAIVELDWIVSNDTVVRPDMIAVCGDVPEKHLERPPSLIFEILAPSTRQNELTFKRDLYASQGVGIFLLVDSEAKAIEQLLLTSAGV